MPIFLTRLLQRVLAAGTEGGEATLTCTVNTEGSEG